MCRMYVVYLDGRALGLESLFWSAARQHCLSVCYRSSLKRPSGMPTVITLESSRSKTQYIDKIYRHDVCWCMTMKKCAQKKKVCQFFWFYCITWGFHPSSCSWGPCVATRYSCAHRSLVPRWRSRQESWCSDLSRRFWSARRHHFGPSSSQRAVYLPHGTTCRFGCSSQQRIVRLC